ncbi:hypothetical protein [Kutzneria buriramensis]|uniref:Membrane protein DUF2157 n=1 Tax=Kutzneria buriramensis TaxID=1045776 RepID=A0A3E0HP90_9PSEU|nr:hypothetical protein [Kutzneria buriramensis]REH48231.1 hypothetical protein BCF44_10589 [Kutzneria buriramensis]
MTRLAHGQERALGELVSAGKLSARDANTVRDALTDADPAPLRHRIAEVLGYVGGALLLAGAALIVGMSWDSFSHAGRVWLLIAVTVVLVGASVALRNRVTGLLLALAAVTGGLAASAAFDTHPALAGGIAALILAVAGYAACPAVFAIPVAGIAGGSLVVGLVDLLGASPTWTGVGLVVLGVVGASLVAFDVVRHRAVTAGVATALALIGAQFPEHAFVVYCATLAVALVCFACYLADRMPILLIGGVIGVTIAVPEAVWDWTRGTVNAAVLVLIAGAVLLLAGGIGLRIHRP